MLPRGPRASPCLLSPLLPAADGSAGSATGFAAALSNTRWDPRQRHCTAQLDNARSFLIGKPHEGLAAMFTYMNGPVSVPPARVRQRRTPISASATPGKLAMRSLSGAKNPDGPADAIVEHPDVRRMLLTQRVIAEGGRAMVTYASQFADLYGGGKTEKARSDEEARLGFCTPILKGFITELGVEAANHGVQVFGGHGYIQEWGMEQILRDSRIATIYEGTTGIQALDLVGRKVLLDKFKQLNMFTGDMLKFACQFLP